MSYQYPSSLRSTFDSRANVINLPEPQPQPRPSHHHTLRNNAPHSLNPSASRVTKATKHKRSMATPNSNQAGNAATDAAALAMSAERRRNKLGYHRTSVACGHCRRRKIRCIPASGDPQRRCSNCIRLKKECNFYPVDSSPQQRRPSRRPEETGPGTQSASPTIRQEQNPPPMNNGLAYPPSMNENAGPSMDRRQPNGSFSPDNRAPVYGAPPPYKYQNPPVSWTPSEPSPVSRASEASSSHWRPSAQESPVTPAYSPYSHNINPHQVPAWPPLPSQDPNPREEMGWAVPSQRSMSYGQVQDIQRQYPSFHQPSPQMPPRAGFAQRTGSHQPDMYALSLSGTNSTIPASESAVNPHLESSQAPGPSLPPPFAQNQAWQPQYPQFQRPPVSAPGEAQPGWYGGGGPSPNYPEEGNSAPGHGHFQPGPGMDYYPTR